MALAQNVARLDEAEYLRLERQADYRSEFFDGEMIAMAGGTRQHSLIGANVVGEMRAQLTATNCVTYNSELKVKIEATGLFVYPDVSIVCGEQRFLDQEQDVLLNPTMIVEVLSDSTEAYDRGKKFEHYRQIPSLRAYLLVSQKEPIVEMFYLHSTGEWSLKEAAGMNGKLELPAFGIVVRLAEVYARVQFPPTRLR